MKLPKVTKEATSLVNLNYNHPRTILTKFRFEPEVSESSDLRLRKSLINKRSVEGKDIYLIDDFFSKDEGQEMRNFYERADFEVPVFSSRSSQEKNEKPSFSMNGKDKWKFFSLPPSPIQELYRLLALIAHDLHVDVTTHPWSLSSETCNAPAFVVNYHREISEESAKIGKHRDYNTQKGVPFGVRKLYAEKEELHQQRFINGEQGKPWLITAMLYSTSEGFLPGYGMGSGYYKGNGEKAEVSECLDMRLIFFEGDVIHGVEKGNIPKGENPWRISYVFKLMLNPKEENQNIKKEFSSFMLGY